MEEVLGLEKSVVPEGCISESNIKGAELARGLSSQSSLSPVPAPRWILQHI